MLRFSIYKGYQMHFSTIMCKAPQESTAAWLFGLSRCSSSSSGKVNAYRTRRPIQNQDVMQVMEDAWTDNGGWGCYCKFVPFRLMLSIPAAGKWQKINYLWRAEIPARKEQIYEWWRFDGSLCSVFSKKPFHTQLKKPTFVRKKCQGLKSVKSVNWSQPLCPIPELTEKLQYINHVL